MFAQVISDCTKNKLPPVIVFNCVSFFSPSERQKSTKTRGKKKWSRREKFSSKQTHVYGASLGCTCLQDVCSLHWDSTLGSVCVCVWKRECVHLSRGIEVRRGMLACAGNCTPSQLVLVLILAPPVDVERRWELSLAPPPFRLAHVQTSIVSQCSVGRSVKVSHCCWICLTAPINCRPPRTVSCRRHSSPPSHRLLRAPATAGRAALVVVASP